MFYVIVRKCQQLLPTSKAIFSGGTGKLVMSLIYTTDLKQVIIVAVILVLIAFSIPALFVILGDFQTTAASEFNISEFSPFILLPVI